MRMGYFAPVMIAALGLAGTAAAQTTALGNLRVQAAVFSACSVQDSTLDFGPVSPASPPATRAQADIKVTCTGGTAYEIGIGDGDNAQGAVRRMLLEGSSGADPADFLHYELYKQLTGANRWGNAIASERVTGVGNGVTQNIPVFGQLFAGPAIAGNYADNAVITLHF